MAGVQDGPTGIRVTWTPPVPLDGVTGYRIHYTTGGGSSGSQTVSGGNTMTDTLTGLTNGETYTISIVATSSALPSSPVQTTVGLGKSTNTWLQSTGLEKNSSLQSIKLWCVNSAHTIGGNVYFRRLGI